ncbi:MAG: hypothetical protein J6T24_05250 [Clostridia bacterium]|nr:hypothetical protein [Clostridia bacterium]
MQKKFLFGSLPRTVITLAIALVLVIFLPQLLGQRSASQKADALVKGDQEILDHLNKNGFKVKTYSPAFSDEALDEGVSKEDVRAYTLINRSSDNPSVHAYVLYMKDGTASIFLSEYASSTYKETFDLVYNRLSVYERTHIARVEFVNRDSLYILFENGRVAHFNAYRDSIERIDVPSQKKVTAIALLDYTEILNDINEGRYLYTLLDDGTVDVFLYAPSKGILDASVPYVESWKKVTHITAWDTELIAKHENGTLSSYGLETASLSFSKDIKEIFSASLPKEGTSSTEAALMALTHDGEIVFLEDPTNLEFYNFCIPDLPAKIVDVITTVEHREPCFYYLLENGSIYKQEYKKHDEDRFPVTRVKETSDIKNLLGINGALFTMDSAGDVSALTDYYSHIRIEGFKRLSDGLVLHTNGKVSKLNWYNAEEPLKAFPELEEVVDLISISSFQHFYLTQDGEVHFYTASTSDLQKNTCELMASAMTAANVCRFIFSTDRNDRLTLFAETEDGEIISFRAVNEDEAPQETLLYSIPAKISSVYVGHASTVYITTEDGRVYLLHTTGNGTIDTTISKIK